MKSENQKIVRYKQPIKTHKPFECLLRLLSFFSSFYFLSALQCNAVYILGHNIYSGTFSELILALA